MLDGIAHWRPLVNGDSGFVPRPYARARELLDRPLEGEPLRLLRALGVAHVASRDAQPLPRVAEPGGALVYEVPPGEPAAAPAAGEPVATMWTAEGTVVDLGATRSVGGLAFELDDRPWLDRPSVEMSVDGSSWVRLDATASLADATLALYRDPRHGGAAVRFGPVQARWLRVETALPARPGLLAVMP
jgi:hypothetical protein